MGEPKIGLWHHQFELNDEIKNKWNFYKMVKEKKLEIQKIRSKLESIIFGKLGLKDAIKNK